MPRRSGKCFQLPPGALKLIFIRKKPLPRTDRDLHELCASMAADIRKIIKTVVQRLPMIAGMDGQHAAPLCPERVASGQE